MSTVAAKVKSEVSVTEFQIYASKYTSYKIWLDIFWVHFIDLFKSFIQFV